MPMQPVDEKALEDAAWSSFVQRLGDHLAGQWPAMPERLGDRYGAFVDLAVQQAVQRGLTHAAAVARYVNLWFVWGPAFHDKPGFEWAQGLLAAPAAREWVTVHQLVRRSLLELQRLPGARIDPQALVDADARVQDTFGPLGRQGAMSPLLRAREPEPLPRTACDLEAADVRVLDDGWHHEYRLQAGDWQRVPVPMPAPLRIDAARACPPLLAVLSQQRDHGPQARLQLRVRGHAACDGDLHPALLFTGPHGLWRWAGHETRAVSWPVATREQPLPAAGPGSSIGEETAPELHKLVIETCGLRDEGDPLGLQKTVVSAWPAAQWWLELQRAMPAQQALLPGARPWVRGATRCRVERDGRAQDSAALKSGFEDGLDAALAAALQQLAADWQQVPGLTAPRCDATVGLLTGRASATWGWRFGPQGLDGKPLMRVVAALEMDAARAELELAGELALGSTRTRLVLRVAGQAPLRQTLQREAAVPTLPAVLMPAVARWQWPFTLALEPLADDSAALLQATAPVTGALVGEAGLRPGTHGSSGWEWYVLLRLEAVSARLCVADPLLGQSQLQQPLLPARTLIDWSLG
jgi:hypothetical protein